jgi:KilA-N domain.
MTKIIVKDTDLTIIQVNNEDYICITDLARYKNAEHTDDVIKNWMRNRNTIELLGIFA